MTVSRRAASFLTFRTIILLSLCTKGRLLCDLCWFQLKIELLFCWLGNQLLHPYNTRQNLPTNISILHSVNRQLLQMLNLQGTNIVSLHNGEKCTNLSVKLVQFKRCYFIEFRAAYLAASRTQYCKSLNEMTRVKSTPSRFHNIIRQNLILHHQHDFNPKYHGLELKSIMQSLHQVWSYRLQA